MTDPLIDRFGREVTYLRMSVTDRCDFRCVYCMAEEMTFLPRDQILTLEELAFIGETFVELGVSKLRITGGEPLVRHNVSYLFNRLGQNTELSELVLTTNGSQLPRLAPVLKSAGVKRINISLDSLNPAKFRRLTRTGDLSKVLAGIQAAKDYGFEQTKLNSVILKGRNEMEAVSLVEFALENGHDISFIEEMPLGVVDEHDRQLSFCPSHELRDLIEEKYPLFSVPDNTGGPSRYWRTAGYKSRIGFISPHSENFCSDCNRVRLTAEGRLLLCLGNEHSVDLREVVRHYPNDRSALMDAIRSAVEIKPERHFFDLSEKEPQILRFMNMTGG